MADGSIRVCEVQFFRHPMRTRFPFRFGIASMSQLPHLFVRVTIEQNGRSSTGISADGLPPKWFTKNPETSFAQDDLPAMLNVIRNAAHIALDTQRATSVFRWWQELYTAQHDWASGAQIAPLLANFGVSLLERAVIDAVCRLNKTTLFQYLRSNGPAIDLGAVRPNLRGLKPADVLAQSPRRQLQLRHTIGMADPLTVADSGDLDVDDGLPLTLQENIRAYGLRYFKIKLSGDLDVDRRRLIEIATMITADVGVGAKFTLDGNEQFSGIRSFRNDYQTYLSEPLLQKFFAQSLLFVEQPIHRDHALDESVAAELDRWSGAPPMIIDESDADLQSLPSAIALGYSGTSHKNCKGIIKSVVNAATICQARTTGKNVMLSGEDLVNVGPVALQQDLAMVSALGIDHVERNGHHYFAGLGHLSSPEQQQVVAHHGDLYQMHKNGFAALAPVDGMITIGSVVDAPFGYVAAPDLSHFVSWNWQTDQGFSV